MYFIKYQPLKEKLRERTLSEREALPYLIVSTAIVALLLGIPLYERYNVIDGISAVVSIALAIFGILFAYKQNGKEEGFDFIKKYVVLGWITGVRFFIVFVPLGVVLILIAGYLGFSAEETNEVDLILQIVFEALLYYRIGRHIKDTRKAIKTE